MTINQHIENLTAAFLKLSVSRQKKLQREAAQFIRQNPGCADHSNFWRGLSARQVTAAS